MVISERISDLLKDASVSISLKRGQIAAAYLGASRALNPTEQGEIWPEFGQCITSAFKI